jgi:hypothetical protein
MPDTPSTPSDPELAVWRPMSPSACARDLPLATHQARPQAPSCRPPHEAMSFTAGKLSTERGPLTGPTNLGISRSGGPRCASMRWIPTGLAARSRSSSGPVEPPGVGQEDPAACCEARPRGISRLQAALLLRSPAPPRSAGRSFARGAVGEPRRTAVCAPDASTADLAPSLAGMRSSRPDGRGSPRACPEPIRRVSMDIRHRGCVTWGL